VRNKTFLKIFAKKYSSLILPANEESFHGINPSDLLSLLFALPATDCKDGKAIWKSYKSGKAYKSGISF